MLDVQKIEAVIFDMDGVISDTQKYHAQSEAMLLATYGIIVRPEDISKRFAGFSAQRMFTEIFTEFDKIVPDISELEQKKWSTISDIVDGVEPIEGSVELIQGLFGAKYPLAVASASPKHFIDRVISELELQQYFLAFVSADQVAEGKPAPDVFLEAAKKIGIDPENCLVIEDGRSGIVGAKAAGMFAVAYGLEDTEADLHVETMDEIYQVLLGNK